MAILLVLLLLFPLAAWPAGFLLSAPPTETASRSAEIYQPIAEFFSRITGDVIRYEYPENWPAYVRNMQNGRYDIVVDAPHFVSWRSEKLEHLPLVSLADKMEYVVVVRDEPGIKSLQDLRGKTACSAPIPNMDALALLDQYESSWSQPKILATVGFAKSFEMLSGDECDAAVLPLRTYLALVAAPGQSPTRLLFTSQVMPHLAFSASPRLGERRRTQIRDALLGNASIGPMVNLNRHYGLDGTVMTRVVADPDAYSGYAYLLEEFWGF